MGELRRHPLLKWREQYGLEWLVETGTFRGNGVAAALQAGFPRVITIDVVAQCVVNGRKAAGSQAHRVDCILGDSVEVLPEVLRTLYGRAMFWLDAHYPDVYGEGTGAEPLPLLREVLAIVEAERDHSKDLILCDDLRIYGVPAPAGPLPARSQPGAYQDSVPLQPGDPRELQLIRDALIPTHDLVMVNADGGYLVAHPKV